MKCFRSIIVAACVALGAIAPAAPGQAQDAPFGRMVSVAEHRLHLNCTGAGAPVVVLESGLGANHLDWLRVQPTIAASATVCSYDRAGYGWSERGPKPRTVRVIATELHALLAAADLPPPYLLVGHSFGGLVVRIFAADWPQDTAGLLLIDAMTPDQFAIFAAAGVDVPVEPTRGIIYSSRAVLTYGIPEPYRDLAYALARGDKTRSFLYNELRNIEVSMAEVRAARLPPGLPVRVLAHGDRGWDADLARDLGGGAPVIAAAAGHQVQLDDPGVVNALVLAMLADLRSQAPRD